MIYIYSCVRTSIPVTLLIAWTCKPKHLRDKTHRIERTRHAAMLTPNIKCPYISELAATLEVKIHLCYAQTNSHQLKKVQLKWLSPSHKPTISLANMNIKWSIAKNMDTPRSSLERGKGPCVKTSTFETRRMFIYIYLLNYIVKLKTCILCIRAQIL